MRLMCFVVANEFVRCKPDRSSACSSCIDLTDHGTQFGLYACTDRCEVAQTSALCNDQCCVPGAYFIAYEPHAIPFTNVDGLRRGRGLRAASIVRLGQDQNNQDQNNNVTLVDREKL